MLPFAAGIAVADLDLPVMNVDRAETADSYPGVEEEAKFSEGVVSAVPMRTLDEVSTSPVPEESDKSCSDQELSEVSTQSSDSEAHEITSTVFAAIQDGTVSLHVPIDMVKRAESKVHTFQSDGSTFRSATLPIGGEFSMVSNLTVLFDDQGEIVDYGETLITENSAGNFNITSYKNGEFVNSDDTDLTYMTDAQLEDGMDSSSTSATPEVQNIAWGTAACVASVLGVSGAVAYLIVGACTGSCAIPGVGTAVCVACIGAYAAVGGTSITAVASCFK